MSDINIVSKIRNEFPQLRKPENLSKVLLVAKLLDATSTHDAQKRIKFEAEGVSSYMLKCAIKLKVLQRNKVSYYRFLISERHSKIKDENIDSLINLELKGLFSHMDNDIQVMQHVKYLLKLYEKSVEEVKEFISGGPTNKKIDKYDKIINSLKNNKLYNKNYDYQNLFFRARAAKYWLTDLGKEIIRGE